MCSLKRAVFGAEMRIADLKMHTVTTDAQVTTSGSHIGRQVLGEVYRCLVDVFMWQLFFGIEFVVPGTFQHGRQT